MLASADHVEGLEDIVQRGVEEGSILLSYVVNHKESLTSRISGVEVEFRDPYFYYRVGRVHTHSGRCGAVDNATYVQRVLCG